MMRLLELVVDNHGWPPSGAWSLLVSACAEIEAGQVEHGLSVIAEIAAAAQAERDFPLALMALSVGCKLGYQEGRAASARALGLRATELARQLGDMRAEAQALKWLALLAFDEGRSKDGHDHLLDALALFAQAGVDEELPLLLRWYGEHLSILGSFDEAKNALRQAQKHFKERGDAAGAALCEADLQALQTRVRGH